MNYKEMLDKFEYLEKKLSYLENENKHLKERVTRLEYQYFEKKMPPQNPGFTPGTLPDVWPQPVTGPWPGTNPNQIWCTTETTSRNYGDH